MALLASLSRRCARPLQTLLVMPQALPAVQAAAVVHRGGRNRPLFGSLPSSTSSSCIGAVAGFASNSKWGPMNEDISANVVQLVANDGKLQPNVPFKRALREAQDQGMDLVQVSANGQQVICRIFDARKRMFAMKKSTKAAKPKQDKEVVFGVKIEGNDIKTKVEQVKKFLAKGHKVKVTVKFAKEFHLKHRALDKLADIQEAIPAEEGAADQAPRDQYGGVYVYVVPAK